ncbi:MAG: baseplate tail-tube junction protein, partial [Candidatus Pacebacteria bacterium]|nr:baseplate tail-tube junction protein [Candidatus Paceibacterota bacterium]
DKNKPNSIQIANQATTKLSTVIALYMPPSVSVEYKMNYNEHEIGAVAGATNSAIQAFSNQEAGMVAWKGLKAMGAGLLKTAVDNIPSVQGISEVFQIHAGAIITPRMELMFEGLSRRNFSYNFIFLPKSVKEAETVEEIVKLFKFHSASDYGGGLSIGGIGLGGPDGVRTMTIPDLFDIKYMHMGSDNTHLNKIKTCVLSSISVDYGAERYTAYDEGRPQTTKLALSFTELELITKTYIADGY